ncbi:sacsin N-terminal ATP-binding-like domain-containing protein [Hymenobacter fodinae]|uniref:Uncharacterized protein n=1 Tax=Hymenobacter fodinae TaxID=2510796 RepID=A0A4Z0P4K2_9BACT|nr:hypothetical protein [Hymenobacter fodinae]TGE06106.1 hypothetical protein EU556_14660 [Hymenobacter fodinae]
MNSDFLAQESAVQKSMNRNNYMLSARDIFRTLKELRQNKKLSNRRWVWELLQNAKDVRNRFERVSVVVEHMPTHLRFRHNGNPFSIDNLTCLIQQVSSKLSDSSDEEQTGKWGTGFISTHLLATTINVTGIVDCEGRGYRRFSLLLDRSGDTAEALLESIRATSLEVLRLEDNDDAFPPQPEYEERRHETDFDTEFSYELLTPENKEAAVAGIADLILTLPSALLNIPRQKIKLVQVKQLDGTTITFDVEPVQHHGNITGYTITSSADTPGAEPTRRHFYAYETDELRLLAEVTNFTAPALVPPRPDQPVLYRDFPLIGSERFHFPFALNSSEFYPNERRDGIFLNATEDKEIQRNRTLLVAAQAAALDFTRWLIEQNVCNRYVLVNTRVPEVPGDGLDADARKWYEQLQIAWRHELLDLLLVETEAEAGTVVPLRQVRIPRLQANAKQEDNEALWELAVDFLGKDAVPRRDLLPMWSKALGVEEEMESWGETIFLKVEHLLQLVGEKKTLAALPMVIAAGGDEKVGIDWLNALYAYLAKHELMSLLRAFPVVPNQFGDLRLLNEKLFVERPDELIPAPVLDVLHQLDLPWRDELLRRDIELPNYTHQERALRDASTVINTKLKEPQHKTDALESAFLQRDDAQQILVDLLRLTSPNADDTTLRSQLFQFVQDLLHVEGGPKTVESLQYFDFYKATQLLTMLLNETIEKAGTLVGLAAELRMESPDAARHWLGRYLKFLEGSRFKSLLEYGNIVPNQELEGRLCAYEDLYRAGTRELPLDDELLDILKELDGTQDWRPKLLAKGIDLEIKPYTFADLGSIVASIADELLRADEYKQHTKALLNLIGWCRASTQNTILAGEYLGKFSERLTTHWFTLTVANSGNSKQAMRLFEKPEQIDDLVAIADSGKVAKLRKLVNSSDDVLDRALRFVSQLELEVDNFRFLQSIGAEMERAFKEALLEAGVTVVIEPGSGTTATVAQIDYHGIGSYDFAVRNLATNKAFYLELKSFKKDNPQHIRLAQSQAKRAAKDEEPFALCVVGRDRRAEDVTAEHVRQELTYVKDLQATMEPIAKEIEHFEQLYSQTDAPVWFDVSSLHQSKVFVTHEFIDDRRNSFEELIRDIKAAIL